MACSSMHVPTPHIATARRGILGGETRNLRRSSSGEELYKQATMKRSSSDNHLLSSSTQLRAASSSPGSSKLRPNRSFGIFSYTVSTTSTSPAPIKSLLFETETGSKNDMQMVEDSLDDDDDEMEEEEVKRENRVKRANWVQRLLELRTRWKSRKEKEINCRDAEEGDCDGDEDGCQVDYGETEDELVINSESFSKLLVHDLWRYHGLEFVTSSLEKKAKAIELNARLANDSTSLPKDELENLQQRGNVLSPSVAYEIAASAACHVQNQAKVDNHYSKFGDAIYTGSSDVCPVPRGCNSEMAAQMAATTMTAVVAAKEREKQAAATELQSLHSSPCEWFVCDDPNTRVRYFVIQGSESLASWQANLFFEPAKFEDTDAAVHRGIYEAAKGIYEQFMPEIQDHLDCYGEDAKFQFTGHSLGGSLSLLVSMMLIAKGVVKPSTFLPVVTFGSPFVFCGGEKILKQLRMDEDMVQNVIMHRDIVPRAFSCNYPTRVEQVLKRLNNSFKSHPCLNKHKMLYSPLGQVYILQPPEKQSPSHPLLPQGCAFYAFDKTQQASVAVALREFLNKPHPLETLSDPRAYGSEGTILRDHDSNNYIKAVTGVMKQYRKIAFRKVKKERHAIWPLITSPSQYSWTHEGILENASTRQEVMTSV
ncbi:Phospholipase A1 PLIP1 chloroplastic [Bienertia sinuspersici]